MPSVYDEKPDRSTRNIALVLAVFALLCGAVMYYLATHMTALVAKNPQRLDLYYKDAKQFDSTQKALFLKSHAGFWTRHTETLAGGLPLTKDDRLEFKDNGIIWEVVAWEVTMPAGNVMKFVQVRTAWVAPFGTLQGDTLGDAFTIHQTFIRAKEPVSADGTSSICGGSANPETRS